MTSAVDSPLNLMWDCGSLPWKCTVVMLFWRIRHTRWRQVTTGVECCCSKWSLARRSLIDACCGSFTPSCIGSMYQSESHTRWPSWCLAVYVVKRRSTCLTSANQSWMSRHGVISDLLIDDSWMYRTSGGLSQCLADWSGTRCWTIWETR